MINVLRLILSQKESYFNYLKKRQLILTLVLLAIKRTKKLMILQWIIKKYLNGKNKKRSIRSRWRFCRNTGWWELVWTQYDDKRFKETFRISRDTFKYILSEIRVNIEKQHNAEERIKLRGHVQHFSSTRSKKMLQVFYSIFYPWRHRQKLL